MVCFFLFYHPAIGLQATFATVFAHTGALRTLYTRIRNHANYNYNHNHNYNYIYIFNYNFCPAGLRPAMG